MGIAGGHLVRQLVTLSMEHHPCVCVCVRHPAHSWLIFRLSLSCQKISVQVLVPVPQVGPLLMGGFADFTDSFPRAQAYSLMQESIGTVSR